MIPRTSGTLLFKRNGSPRKEGHNKKTFHNIPSIYNIHNTHFITRNEPAEMAQNNDIQYVHMPIRAKGHIAPEGHVYQLPAIALVGAITAARSGNQKIGLYKTWLSFNHDEPSRELYAIWRNTVKDQMLARNFANINTFPNDDFRQIFYGMRRLRPACDELVRTSANNVSRRRQIEEAIISLIKDCGKKLTDTILGKGVHQPAPGASVTVPANVLVDQRLLPLGAPTQLGTNAQQPPVVVERPAAQDERDDQ